MAEVVEIRVHGVGGAPAGDVLDDPHPRLVAGDRVSGFWESKDPRTAPAGYSRRALAWGGTTSGSWQQALWVTLLPFALVNVGGWMHPPGKRPSRLVRVFGATLTLSTVLLAAVTAYDVVAIQCGSDRACVAGHAWLAPLTWQWGDIPIFVGRPAPRLALLTVLPGGLLVLLWFAGRYAYRQLESYYPLGREAVGGDGIDLSHADFWRGAEPAYRTRMLHLAAARALIAATLSWGLAAVLSGRAQGAALAVFSASALLVVAACGWVAWPGLYFRGPNLKLKPWLARLSGATWLVLGAALGIGASVPLSGPGRLFVAAIATVAGLGAVVLSARPTTVGPAVLGGAALSLGLLVGVLSGDPAGGQE
ncbi:MAG: hypothetical protein M3276_05055, partial [Actinomycetota bacterium]|nr:hypothetical protein [Actinomycetota bacterium]